MDKLFLSAKLALEACHIEDKIVLTEQLYHDFNADRLDASADATAEPSLSPGRPERPLLVHPRQLKRRSLHTEQGRIVLLHALAHIEFNAINLALDAICRFQHMPLLYYRDWLKVAFEESTHFQLLTARLQQFDTQYGDYPGHDGLWDMARRTADDVLVRMALVPRVLEARGLDVTPAMIEQFTQQGDSASADILNIILRDEITHVAIGSRWFHYLCEQRKLDPETTFKQLLDEHFNGQLRGPFNHQARRQAGFSESELATLFQ